MPHQTPAALQARLISRTRTQAPCILASVVRTSGLPVTARSLPPHVNGLVADPSHISYSARGSSSVVQSHPV